MVTRARENRFGEYLKGLRARAGLSLRAVADASRGIERKIGDPISNGYLSLLELGRASAVSLRKLVTLATIYVEPLDRMIAEAPPELRRRLIAERDASPAHSSLPIDEPPDDRGGVADALNAWFEDVLRAAAVNVTVPLGRERQFMRLARETMSWVLLPALVRHGGPEFADAFWRDAVARYRLVFAGPPSWEQVAEDARRWYINGDDARSAVESVLESWSVEGPRRILHCELARRAPEPRTSEPTRQLAALPTFGDDPLSVDGVPMQFAAEIRRAQAIKALVGRAPAELRISEPPDVFWAARRFIADEAGPSVHFGQWSDVVATLQTCAALARLLSEPSRPPDDAAPAMLFDPSACAAFVHRAEHVRILDPVKSADDDEPPPQLTKPAPAPPDQLGQSSRRAARGRKRDSPDADA